MVIEGRTTQQIRKFNAFKVGIGLVLFTLALVSAFGNRPEAQPVASASAIGQDVVLPTPAPVQVATETVVQLVEVEPSSPTLLLSHDGDIFAGERYVLGGRGEPGWEVTLRTANDYFVGETTVQPNGEWRIDVLFETIGMFEFVAEMVEPTGGELLRSEALKVDALQPALPLKAPTFEALSSAEFNAGDTISFRGTGTPLIRLGLFINEMLFDVVEVDIDGIWTFDARFVEPGGYNVRVQVLTDGTTETLQSDVIQFALTDEVVEEVEVRPTVVATALLTPTFESSEVSGLFRGGTVDINGRANPRHTLEVVVNNSVLDWLKPDNEGGWSYTMAFEAPDTYTYFVRAVDADGSILSRTDFVSLRLLPQVDTSDNDEGLCDGFYSPGEFLPDSQYRVAACETFSSIADRSGVNVEALRAANPDIANPALIEPGQVLTLPTP